jgi:hypothetical protein
MGMSGHIFISYKSIESQFAHRLTADLKNAGIQVWMDRLETEGVQGSQNWINVLTKALHESIGLLCILTPEYFQSQYCLAELNFAFMNNLIILPVLICDLRDIPQNQIPFWLPQIQHFDFINWMDSKIYEKRLLELTSITKTQISGAVGNEPAPEIRYINTLIADLEARKGVLEYVELSAQADAPIENPTVRPQPRPDEEWAAGFSVLLPQKREEAKEVKASIPRKTTLASITEVLEKYTRFVIIGEPGAGKTTTLRRLALEAAYQCLENSRIYPFPLFVYLPQWGEESTPLEFIQAHWPFKNDLSNRLVHGDVLLYLDGLNEMGDKGIEKAELLRDWISSGDGPKHVIVTCRARDYKGGFELGLPTVLTEQLSEKQIIEFATKYLENEADLFLRQLIADRNEAFWEDDETSSLFSLAQNPYLLSALIFLYRNTSELPRNTGRLFQALTQTLWERERLKQTHGWIPSEQMESSLAKLAFYMIHEGMSTNVPYPYALQQIGNGKLLRAAESANLIEIEGTKVHFYHQLMQEYFAAIHLLNNESLINDFIEPSFEISAYRINKEWDSVIVALSGIITRDSIAEFIQTLMDVNLPLAARCIASGIEIPYELSQELITKSLAEIPNADEFARADLAFTLMRINYRPTSITDKVILYLAAQDWDEILALGNDAIATIHRIAQEWTWSSINLYELLAFTVGFNVDYLIELLNDWRSDLREEAAIALGDIEDTLAVKPLIDILENDPSWFVQSAAAGALWRIGTSEAQKAEQEWRRKEMIRNNRHLRASVSNPTRT